MFDLTEASEKYAREPRPFQEWDRLELIIDPQTRTLDLNPYDAGDSTYTRAESRHLQLTIAMGARYSGAAYRVLLGRDDVQALLERIATGHTTFWRDIALYGRFSEDALDAYQALIDLIATIAVDYPGDYSIWQAADWFQDWQGGVTAQTTDDELDQIIRSEVTTADSENAVIPDLADWLRAKRDELRAEAEEAE